MTLCGAFSRAAVVSLLVVSNSWAQGVERRTCRELARTFFVNPQQEEDEFKAYDVDRQFTVYVCAMQYMHPPMMEFADWFALGGRPVADYLRQQLMRAQDDETVRDIVHVFVYMSIHRTYDVRGDVALMRLVESRVGEIRDANVRASAQMLLNRVRQR